jgi:hypothetical protein
MVSVSVLRREGSDFTFNCALKGDKNLQTSEDFLTNGMKGLPEFVERGVLTTQRGGAFFGHSAISNDWIGGRCLPVRGRTSGRLGCSRQVAISAFTPVYSNFRIAEAGSSSGRSAHCVPEAN